jgi:uncharacterized protein
LRSTDNVRRLRNEPGVRLALVQSDVIQAFLDEAQNGNADALQMIKPLRAVLPLYDEEIYFVVRADSPVNAVHEIRDLRINVGPVGSGTALTATTLYRKMFGVALAERNLSHESNEEALLKLTTEASIDVVVIVAGQPTKLFAEMRPEARQYIKLLRFDAKAPASAALADTYTPSAIRASNYPNWLAEDVPALTTQALLVTYDYQSPGTQQMLVGLARSLCSNFEKLQAEGHPKWQNVRLELPPLGRNWRYYAPTERELMACRVARHRDARGQNAAASCPQARAVLGLCNTSGVRPQRQRAELSAREPTREPVR